jgi:aminopeptidase N
MRQFRFPVVLALPTIALFSCTAPRKTVSTRNLMDTITVSARNNPMDIYRATTPRIWDIRRTIVQITPDWQRKEADGNVGLEVWPLHGAKDTLVLDAQNMQIDMVAVGTRTPPYRYDSSQLHIYVGDQDFGTESAPKPLQIRIRYLARPYSVASGGSAAIKDDRGLYFINTDGSVPGKPRQIWTQGETESNSNWLPTIDKPNQRTRVTLLLTVPDTMQSLGNGRLVNSSAPTNGFRVDTWQTDTAIQAYAIMFAIGRFDKTVDAWKHPSGKQLEVAYYTEPEYKPYARNIFRNTPEMLSFFSRATGVPYPWEKYSQIIARDYVSGAMENTSASLFGEFMNQNDRQLIDATPEDIVSHELFHQWFGDYVTAESWSNLTVNESFATFGEILWREHKYGKDNAAELAYEDKQRYLNAAERLDPPLVRFHYRDREEMFDRISYQKGGAILRYIHSIIGDAAFSTAMKIYLTENALQSAEATNWRLAIEKATGQDWTQFFNEWYFRGGHPQLIVKQTYDDTAGKLRISVRQQNHPDSTRFYTLPLEFRELGHNAIIRTVARREQEFVYDYRNGKRPYVLIDPDNYLPGTIGEKKPLHAWIQQLDSGGHGARRAAINTARYMPKDPDAIQVYRLALKHRDPGTRLHALNMLGTVSDAGWQESLKAEIVYLLQNETQSKVLAAAYKVAGEWGLRNERKLMEEAVWDSSYFVSGAALSALNKIDKDTAYMLAKRIVATRPRTALADAVWQIIGKHGERQDFGLLERYSTGLYGSARQRMMERVSFFASETTDDTLYRRSIERILQEARLEQDNNSRFSTGSLLIRLRRYYDLEASKKGRDARIATNRAAWAKELETALISGEKDAGVKERLQRVGRGGEE